MADIRINSLSTTASASSSDDFLPIDGSANGTRKLNAYSPTFGGNLTVSGTGTSTFSGPIRINASASAPTAGSFSTSAGNGLEIWPKSGSNYDLLVYTAAGSSLLSVPSGTNNLTLAGNLTVSGTGTSSVAGTLNVSGGFILNRINAKGIYTGTSDNCGFTWTGTNGEFSTASGSLILKSAGTTALTLDASQNATFAKGATINSGAADTRALRLTENGTRTLDFTVTSGATADINANIALRLFSAGTLALTLDSTQQAKFSSAVYCNTTTQSSGVTGAKLITKQTSGTNDWTVTLDGNPDGVAGASYGLRILAGTNSSDYSLYVRNQTNTTTLLAVKGSGRVNMGALPTSSTGLSAGDIWNDAGTLKIV